MVSLALHGIGRASPVALALIIVAASLAAQGGRGAGPVSEGRSEDCLPYDADSLILRPQPDNAWLLTDGHDRMVVFDNRKDADNALALAQRYRMQCFIGRHASTRASAPGRPSPEYMLRYWKLPTGKTTTISPESCTLYVPARLMTFDKGSAGWIVTDGGSLVLKLDNKSDADAALAIAKEHSQRCVIGRDDLRPLSLAYPQHSRVDYWK